MTQVLERAKHGQAEAIALLLNRYFKPQGIFARVIHEEHRLQVLLESMDIPDPKRILRWLLATLEELHPDDVSMVQIYAKRAGDTAGAWVETFAVQPNRRLMAIDSQTPGQSRYVRGDLIELSRQGDLSAIQAFVDEAIGNPNLRVHVALMRPVLKITIQTIQFLDGQHFAVELAEKIRTIASDKIQIVEIYKQKTAGAPPFLLQRIPFTQ
jgi:hypothetical protein